jgi:hypothetical protein
MITRLAIILTMVLTTLPIYAQTATPLPTTTPAPTPIIDDMSIMYPGFYESSNGGVMRAGDWVAAVCGGVCEVDDEYLYTDVNGTMHARFYGDGIIINRMVGPEYGLMEVCANGWCSLIDNYDAGAMGSSAHTMLLRPGYYHLSLRNASTTGARLAVDAITVLDDSQTYLVPTPTPLPSPTPNFVEHEFTIGGDAYTGGYALNFTAGDVTLAILLIVIAIILTSTFVWSVWSR